MGWASKGHPKNDLLPAATGAVKLRCKKHYKFLWRLCPSNITRKVLRTCHAYFTDKENGSQFNNLLETKVRNWQDRKPHSKRDFTWDYSSTQDWTGLNKNWHTCSFQSHDMGSDLPFGTYRVVCLQVKALEPSTSLVQSTESSGRNPPLMAKHWSRHLEENQPHQECEEAHKWGLRLGLY